MSLVGLTLHCKMQPLFPLFSFRLISHHVLCMYSDHLESVLVITHAYILYLQKGKELRT